MLRPLRILLVLFGVVVLAVAGVAFWSHAAQPGQPRDRAIAPFSEPGTPRRIVAFGTSLTRANSWPDTLARAVSDCLGHPVEVVRVARGGADIRWAEAHVDRVLAVDPDLVLMEFAINDADLGDGVSLRRSRALHGAVLSRLTAGIPPGRIVLMTMNPVGGAHVLRRAFLPRHYAQQVTLAQDHGTALADLYAEWLSRPVRNRTFDDGLHPGDQDTARVVVPRLTGLIAAAAGVDCSVAKR